MRVPDFDLIWANWSCGRVRSIMMRIEVMVRRMEARLTNLAAREERGSSTSSHNRGFNFCHSVN